MPGIFILIVLALIAFAVFGFAVHLLFSPWLLLAVIVVFAWSRLRPGRSRR